MPDVPPRLCPVCEREVPRRNKTFDRRACRVADQRSPARREARLAEALALVAGVGGTVSPAEVRVRSGGRFGRRTLRSLVVGGSLGRVGNRYFPASWLPAKREEKPRAE